MSKRVFLAAAREADWRNGKGQAIPVLFSHDWQSTTGFGSSGGNLLTGHEPGLIRLPPPPEPKQEPVIAWCLWCGGDGKTHGRQCFWCQGTGIKRQDIGRYSGVGEY